MNGRIIDIRAILNELDVSWKCLCHAKEFFLCLKSSLFEYRPRSHVRGPRIFFSMVPLDDIWYVFYYTYNNIVIHIIFFSFRECRGAKLNLLPACDFLPYPRPDVCHFPEKNKLQGEQKKKYMYAPCIKIYILYRVIEALPAKQRSQLLKTNGVKISRVRFLEQNHKGLVLYVSTFTYFKIILFFRPIPFPVNMCNYFFLNFLGFATAYGERVDPKESSGVWM